MPTTLFTPTRRPSPLVGQRLDDYLVVDTIGAGAMGQVYLALQMPIGLKAALKVLRPDVNAAACSVERFHSEAAALARLTHPNIVRLLKFGVVDGLPYLVMEYVEGGRTLDQALRSKLTLDQGFQVVRQIVNALEAAHAQGVIHRDVKPGNVMLQAVHGEPLFARLLDFGLVKFTASGDATTAVVGTPRFMAPEQLRRQRIGPWTDFYAVGAIVYQILMGERLHEQSTVEEMLLQKADPAFDPAARAVELEAPAPVISFIRSALAFEVHARPADGTAFLAGVAGAIEAIVQRGQVTSPSVATPADAEAETAAGLEQPPAVTRPPSTPPEPMPTMSAVAEPGTNSMVAAELVAPWPRKPRPARRLLAPAALLLTVLVTLAALWISERESRPTSPEGGPAIRAAARPMGGDPSMPAERPPQTAPIAPESTPAAPATRIGPAPSAPPVSSPEVAVVSGPGAQPAAATPGATPPVTAHASPARFEPTRVAPAPRSPAATRAPVVSPGPAPATRDPVSAKAPSRETPPDPPAVRDSPPQAGQAPDAGLLVRPVRLRDAGVGP